MHKTLKFRRDLHKLLKSNLNSLNHLNYLFLIDLNHANKIVVVLVSLPGHARVRAHTRSHTPIPTHVHSQTDANKKKGGGFMQLKEILIYFQE